MQTNLIPRPNLNIIEKKQCSKLILTLIFNTSKSVMVVYIYFQRKKRCSKLLLTLIFNTSKSFFVVYIYFFCKNNSYNKNKVKTKQKNKNKLRIIEAGMFQNKNINLSFFHKVKYCLQYQDHFPSKRLVMVYQTSMRKYCFF